MFGTLLATGLVVVGRGERSLHARAFVLGLAAQAAGIALVGVAGLAVFASGEDLGASFRARSSRAWASSHERVLSLRPRCRRRPCARLWRLVTSRPTGRPRDRCPLRSVLACPGARALRAGSAAFPGGLGADDARSRRDHPPAAPRPLGAKSVYVYISVTHLMGAGSRVAVLLLADAGAFAGGGVIEAGSGTQVAIALAALVGMGTRRASSRCNLAPACAPDCTRARLGAHERRDDQDCDLRARPRPRRVGRRCCRRGSASLFSPRVPHRRWIGVVYAIFEHELKRLLAFHSIENIGIIVLGLGACLLLRERGAYDWAGVALAAALLHTLNHAVFKSLLFLGAGVFERAAGSARDRPHRRVAPSHAANGTFAFLVGAMAIAGLPPLNGFASEWLTLQALLAVPGNGGVAAGLAGAVALCGSRRDRGACGAVLREGRRARAPRPAASRSGRGGRGSAVPDVGCGLGTRGGMRRARSRSGRARGARAPASHRGRRTTRRARRSTCRGTTCFLHPELPVALLAAVTILAVSAWPPSRSPGSELGVWAARASLSSRGRAQASRSRCGSSSRPCCARSARSPSRCAEAWVQEVRYEGHVPHLFDTHVYRPITRVGLAGARHARRLQSGSLTAYVAYLVALVVVLLVAVQGRADRGELDRRSRRDRPGGGRNRARASRPGARPALEGTPAGPPRALRRSSRIASFAGCGRERASTSSGRPLVYRARAARRGGGAGGCRAPRPRRRRRTGSRRRAQHARARRPARARALRSSVPRPGTRRTASRSWERAATSRSACSPRRRSCCPSPSQRWSPGRPTSREWSPGQRGATVWSSPGLALGAVGFALVVLAETGRQPIDNPDTHLELTMIHEGPLLEYGGRDLALPAVERGRAPLDRARARSPDLRPALHESRGCSSRFSPSSLVVLAAALALVETLVAKMRILLAPRLLAVGAAAGAARSPHLAGRDGVTARFLVWTLVASGLAVVVVRRRSVVVGIVTAQALALALAALVDAESADDVVAGGSARAARRPARRALRRRRRADARAAARARPRAAAPARGSGRACSR